MYPLRLPPLTSTAMEGNPCSVPTGLMVLSGPKLVPPVGDLSNMTPEPAQTTYTSPFGPIAGSDPWTPLVASLTCAGPDQVWPPSVERVHCIPPGVPNRVQVIYKVFTKGLARLKSHAMYSLSSKATPGGFGATLAASNVCPSSVERYTRIFPSLFVLLTEMVVI